MVPELSPSLLKRIVGDQRGAVGLIAGISALPLCLALGMAIDYSELARAQMVLQDAADNAALAGATVYNAADQSSVAIAVATNYLNNVSLPLAVSAGTPSISSVPGTTNFKQSSYNVTVTANASVSLPFLGSVYGSKPITATATAGNPIIKPTLKMGNFATKAADWNAVYLYAVPMSNGKPNYTSIPDVSKFYEVGSNCNSSSSNYSSSSICNGQPGAKVPSSQILPVLASNQPIGLVLENTADGIYSNANSGSGSIWFGGSSWYGSGSYGSYSGGSQSNSSTGYGSNSYGAPAGSKNWFYSAYEQASKSPSETTNFTYTTQGSWGYQTQKTTTYPTSSNSSTPNCSLMVQLVDPSNLPATPPSSSGRCFSVPSMTSGSVNAALTCAQMNGSTYMYWWNDMGGPTDDKDYNDAYFTVSCTNFTGSGTGNTQVVLIK